MSNTTSIIVGVVIGVIGVALGATGLIIGAVTVKQHR